jgi:hypothetical protein
MLHVPPILSLSTYLCEQCCIRLQNSTQMVKVLVCSFFIPFCYEGVSRSFRTGRPERELQMVQLSATRYSCIAILWVSLVSFAAIAFSVASQRVFVIVVYFVIDSVRKLLDTPSYFSAGPNSSETYPRGRHTSCHVDKFKHLVSSCK